MNYQYSSTNDGAKDPEPGYRSIAGLTRFLRALLVASIALGVLSLISTLSYPLESGSTDAAAAFYMREFVLALGVLVLSLLTIVVFAVWIVRAHRNLPALGAENLDVTPGWALGWFFIPIANLWKPYQAMRTLWQASHDAPRWELEDVPWWFTLWWILWLISAVIGRILMRQLFGEETSENLLWASRVELVATVVDVILSGLALLIVVRIGRAQSLQFEARSSVAASASMEGAGAPATDLAISSDAPATPLPRA